MLSISHIVIDSFNEFVPNSNFVINGFVILIEQKMVTHVFAQFYSVDFSFDIDFGSFSIEQIDCDGESFISVTKHLPHESAYKLNEL